jgi:oxaloacetate decarboxylase alpha subunit
MVAIFDETSYSARLDIEAMRKVCRYFLDLAPQRQLRHHQAESIIDPEVLLHHIPGGMISNLRSQLAEQNALDKLDQVFEELPRVRADLGYPPLVTPTSQIIGIQAVMNVLAGQRYELVPQETKDYVRGLYGRSPAPISPKLRRKILGKEKPINCRPADLLPPGLPTATEGIDPHLIQKEEDILSYCLFPTQALDFFKWRALPPDQRPATPADIELKKQEPLEPNPPAPPRPFLAPSDYQSLHDLLNRVQELSLSELTIRRDDMTLSLKAEGMATASTTEARAAAPTAKPRPAAAPAPPPAAPAAPAAAPTAPKEADPKPAEKPQAAQGLTLTAPLAGTFYRSPGPNKPSFVKDNAEVKAGDTLCIVEAMKLFNEIKAPCAARILKFLAEHGQTVKKDDPLVSYEKTG